MEREVNHVQSVMNSLERQRTSLANQMDTLRRTQAKGEHQLDMGEDEDRWWSGEQSSGKGLGTWGCMLHGIVRSGHQSCLTGHACVTMAAYTKEASSHGNTERPIQTGLVEARIQKFTICSKVSR